MTRSRWQSAAQEEDAFGDDIEQATKLALSGRDAVGKFAPPSKGAARLGRNG